MPRRVFAAMMTGLLVLTSACSATGSNPTTSPTSAASTGASPTTATSPVETPTPDPSPTTPSGLWIVLTEMPSTAVLLHSAENADGTAEQGWQVTDQLALVLARGPAIAEATEEAVVGYLESNGSHDPQLQEVTKDFTTELSYPAYLSFEQSGDSNVYNLVILTDEWTFTVESSTPSSEEEAVEVEEQLETLLRSADLVEG